jgi:predicted metalloprotease with PDZ domain
MKEPIVYEIQLRSPEKHLFDVYCHIPMPNSEGQKVSLPVWIPGSYLIRDFAKHVVTLSAYDANGKKCAVKMLDKTTWHIEPVVGPLTIFYQIYAFDLTPRGAYVDTTRAFFNGSRVFLQVAGFAEAPCELKIDLPLEGVYQKWRIASSMSQQQDALDKKVYYTARNYAELIDHPVEIGEFEVIPFEVCSVPHQLVVIGKQQSDLKRVVADLTKICEHHIRFYGEPAPMEKYVFLMTVLEAGYGGIEHRASSVIHCRRDELPKRNQAGTSEAYCNLLGLLSHEYFHTWLVKRIMPAVFTDYDLTKENYTRQLWIFEGITSYYDELALVRSNLISKDQYLTLLSANMTRVFSGTGRFKQTLEHSSFEAWTRFYKPDENTPNATVSYYAKGAWVALGLDLLLRQKTQNECSLDTLMQALWQQYGLQERGLPEGRFEELAMEVSGCDLKGFFNLALRSTEELILDELLAMVGITVKSHAIASVEELNGKMSPRAVKEPEERAFLGASIKWYGTEAILSQVYENEAAELAGLAAGDILLAVNGFKVEKNNVDALFRRYHLGETVKIHAFRRGELMTFTLVLKASTMKNYILSFMEDEAYDNTVQQSWLWSKT